jgi:aspartyl-tRNA(Asn)/glutamyl-tRNA(Gln) amidotransferase subunit B
MEIVSEPDLASPDEAFAYLTVLKQILQYGEVSDCNMEEGNIRCDANISIRPRDANELGVKTEIKNLNTFHGVERALAFEVKRQGRVLDAGGSITQETRRWDDDRGATSAMRTKEYAHDYRYFPEPDLVPVALDDERIEALRGEIPELPAARISRLRTEYGLSEYDAGVLAADRSLADYFEAAARSAAGDAAEASARAKSVANYVINDLQRELASRGDGLSACPVDPVWIARLVGLVESGRISSQMAKDLFVDMYESRRDPEALAAEKGLEQVTDESEILGLVRQAIAEHPKVVADYRGGKANALKFLVGQVMRLSRGKADPQRVNALLRGEVGE